MTTPLTERDFIQLNAYLDGELSATEQAAFEQRLQRDSVLQAELESLRVTVLVLRSAERVPVPRNFTLDPAEHSRPAPFNLWERLTRRPLPALVAAGATIIVVAICAGAAIMRMGGGIAFGPMAARAPAEVAEEAPAGYAVEEAEAEEAVEALPAQAVTMETEEEEAPVEEALMEEPEEPAPEEPEAEPRDVSPQPPEGETTGTGGGEDEAATPEPIPTIAPEPDSTPRPTMTPVEEADIAEAAKDTQNLAATERAMIQDTPGAMVTTQPSQPFGGPVNATVLIAAIGLLIVLLIGLGVVIVVRLRRKS